MNARRLIITILLIGLAAVCFTVQPVLATQAIPPTLEAMTQLSDTIVTGSVTDQYSYWDGDQIFTNVVVTVDQLIKDGPSGTAGNIELRILGGQVGDTKLEIDQAPAFEDGETVMLFLRESGLEHIPFAFHYGVFRIVEDKNGGESEVTGPLFDEPVRFDPLTMHASAESEGGGRYRRLSDFIQRVQSLTR